MKGIFNVCFCPEGLRVVVPLRGPGNPPKITANFVFSECFAHFSKHPPVLKVLQETAPVQSLTNPDSQTENIVKHSAECFGGSLAKPLKQHVQVIILPSVYLTL